MELVPVGLLCRQTFYLDCTPPSLALVNFKGKLLAWVGAKRVQVPRFSALRHIKRPYTAGTVLCVCGGGEERVMLCAAPLS